MSNFGTTAPNEMADPAIDHSADELRNIEVVISITRRNIDALNARFAGLQDPPSMYITEYQELTSRLHELEERKNEILEKLHQNESSEQADESSEVWLPLATNF